MIEKWNVFVCDAFWYWIGCVTFGIIFLPCWLIDWWRWQYNGKWRRPSVIHTNSLICWANSLKEFIICFFFSLIFFFSIACEFFMSKLRYFLIYTVWKIYATHLTQFENKFTFTIIIAHETRISPTFIKCKRKFYIILLKMQCTL